MIRSLPVSTIAAALPAVKPPPVALVARLQEDEPARQLPLPLAPPPGVFQPAPGLVNQHISGRYDPTGQPAFTLVVTGSGCREGGRRRHPDELIVPITKARAKLLGRAFRAVPAYGPAFRASVSGHYGFNRDHEPEIGKNLRASWRLGRWFTAVGGLPGDRIRFQRAVDREVRASLVWLISLERNRRWPWPRREQVLRP